MSIGQLELEDAAKEAAGNWLAERESIGNSVRSVGIYADGDSGKSVNQFPPFGS